MSFSIGTLCACACLGLAGWFWQDSLRAREGAHSACRNACRRAGVQLLDDTVALDRLWLRRAAGRLCLERRYTFEFTITGADRNSGLVVVLGGRVEVLALDGHDLLIP